MGVTLPMSSPAMIDWSIKDGSGVRSWWCVSPSVFLRPSSTEFSLHGFGDGLSITGIGAVAVPSAGFKALGLGSLRSGMDGGVEVMRVVG